MYRREKMAKQLPTEFSFMAGDAPPALTKGKLRVYSMRFCPFALRARIVLAHKGIDVEKVNVNLVKTPDWFLERNPGGQVPVLEIDDKVVYESTACCEYLDDVYPQNKLTPSDPYRKAQDRMLLEHLGKLVSSLFGLGAAADKDKAVADLKKHFRVFESFLAKRKGPYFGDDQLALMDVYTWPFFHQVNVVFSKLFPIPLFSDEEFPSLGAWYKLMAKSPVVSGCLQADEDYVHFMKSLIAGNPDYDYNLKR